MARFSWLILFLGLSTAAQATVGQFKGYAAINQTVYDRVIAPGGEFELGGYLIDNIKTNFEDRGLLDLLGVYDGNGLVSGFKNGAPNGVGMLLWQTTLSAFAQDVGKLCVDPKVIPQSESLKAAMKPLCGWPSADARASAALFTYWLEWMNFDAPYSEFEVWRDFFLSDAFKDAPPAETLSAMTLAILMNPHFLLQK